ncbi:MAG: EF-P beta-lysylation protein EpmB [Gammaproteobacteria bacterium RIFCSPHIGHO2_12_FULL_37_34]|nr:MAG: EF-P beta-lysylation protein EpmB [Gammaproteobacteria bacterium RIFCSPHIGHO2_12_FULL_37_34]
MLPYLEIKKPWQEALSNVITDPKELWALLDLDPLLLDKAYAIIQRFPLKVPRSFVARMQKGNPQDPLLRQVLPLHEELDHVLGYGHDPLLENAVNPLPGLLHKYHGRILVTLTSACGVHCRYCFRRHFPYEKNNPGREGWQKIFDYIRGDPNINEVILSGGDPLSVSDQLLKTFTDELILIPQVTRLRIHTRLLIVLPERVTDEFLKWLMQLPLQVVIVFHVNHPNEINAEVIQALQRLRQCHLTLLNQSVLLKGVNDDATTLIRLSETLFAHGVLPYYLHTLDKVQGAAHFEVDLTHARALHARLCAKLPGYLVPRLVCEQPRKLAKTLL